MAKPHIVILGAGPAGLGAAFQLTRKNLVNVSVIEQSNKVGGSAGSFEHSGVQLDYGSHRLHPSCDPEILNDIKNLLGNDLLSRPRHGRIRLLNRWIHFPLKPLDLAIRMPPSFVWGVLIDSLNKTLRRNSGLDETETFASVLKTGLGQTICKNFYFPYSIKMWGMPPEELSATQANRRVSANSLGKMFRKILSAIPVIKKDDKSRFFYPKNGFGQISESFYKASKTAGAEFYLRARVNSIKMNGKNENLIFFKQDGRIIKHRADKIWSTISIFDLIKFLKPSPPPSIIKATEKIKYRSLILIYLILEQGRFSEYDAHYFPELDTPITRISEVKNYNLAKEPENRTVLCAELPCSINDFEWHMTDKELGKIVYNCMKSANIPIKAPVIDVITKRLPQAYPIYKRGYEEYFDRLDQWFFQMENILTFGRLGLFVHDNTHHALYMGYAAAKCQRTDGYFDHFRWKNFRRIFETHVVED
jgi:protoporphyrinogen oxidase